MATMFSNAINDLAKPQWLAALKALTTTGGMPITRLADQLGVSYMAAKQYGEDLTRLGYLERIRTPRTAVGRPEIFYRIAPKAASLFPGCGMALSLELLENSRLLFGENAPERLIYQHIESQHAPWKSELESLANPHERANMLAMLRAKTGVACRFEPSGEPCARLIEIHHPLTPIFRKYPRSIGMDTRLIEDLLQTRVERIENTNGATGVPRVEFLLPDFPPSILD